MVGEDLAQEWTTQAGNTEPIVEILGGSRGQLEDGSEFFLRSLGPDRGLVRHCRCRLRHH